MFNEAITVGPNRVPVGLKWAMAAAAFLAAITVFIALNMPPTDTTGVVEPGSTFANSPDYGLRHVED